MKNLLTDTYTPLEIEGKIYVVVNAPAKPNLIYRVDYEHYNELLAACTKYETLPEHAPYWKERIGQRVEVEITNNNMGETYAIPHRKACTKPNCSCVDIAEINNGGNPVKSYQCLASQPDPTALKAIPPQQKQDNGDLWDEVFNDWESQTYKSVQTVKSYHNYLKQHYNLTKK